MSMWSTVRRIVPSPAMVVACMSLAVALSGGAYAVTALPQKNGDARSKAGAAPGLKDGSANAAKTGTKLNLYVNRETFTVGVGDVGTMISHCRKTPPHPALAISGGFQLTSGNFVSIVTATVTGDASGFGVTAVVPNAIDSPGVIPAKITVKAICLEKDQITFGEFQNG